MADPTTPNFGLTQPTVGADPDTWGGLLNTNLSIIDTAIGQLSGRNRIINGSCQVSQRGATFVASGSTVGYGGPDRFVAANAATGQFTQSSGTIVYNGVTYPACVQTVNTVVSSIPSGSTYWYGVAQKIEGVNCFDMPGAPSTLSFLFESNVTGTFSAAVTDSSGANTYTTTFAATANTPVVVTLQIPSMPSGAVVPNTTATGIVVQIGALAAGTYMCPTASLGAWQTSYYFSAQGATNWGATANNYIAVTLLSFTKGAYATAFEHQKYSETLRQCQRYYYPTVNEILWAGNTTSGSTYYAIFALPVHMRTTPTVSGVSLSSGAGFTGTPSVTMQNNRAGFSACAASSTVSGGYFWTNATFSAEL